MALTETDRRFHLHLVSDATGETINSVARACLVQFEDIVPTEHTWSLIRTSGQMEKVLAGIRDHPGIVLFTIVNNELREQLTEGCRKLQHALHRRSRSRAHRAGEFSRPAGERPARPPA